MTLEELKNKTVNIKVDYSLKIGDDLCDDELLNVLEYYHGKSDDEILKFIIDEYYDGCNIKYLIEDKYKITIN